MSAKTARRLTLLAACCFLTFGFNLNNCGGGGGKQDPLDKVCHGNECMSIADFSKRMQDALNGQTVGYALTVAYGGLLRDEVAAGLGRTASDPPQKDFKAADRMNVASVNKTVTAVAVLKSLGAKNLDVGTTKIKDYLPGDWTPGENVGDLTFKDLLTHATGFREADGTMPNGNNTGYDDLKKFVERDLKAADKQTDLTCSTSANKSPCYKNQDFALFRVIIPYLNGFKEAGVSDKASALSAAYLAYLNEHVFGPLSIKNVGCAPDKKSPTLFYPFPAGNVNGTDFGDWTALCGGGGIHLSAAELATFLAHLRHMNTLLNEAQRKQMNDELLGWQDVKTVKDGKCRWHGGFLFAPVAGGGSAQDNDFIMDCDNGMQVVLLVNSPVPANVVFNAYEAAWKPK